MLINFSLYQAFISTLVMVLHLWYNLPLYGLLLYYVFSFRVLSLSTMSKMLIFHRIRLIFSYFLLIFFVCWFLALPKHIPEAEHAQSQQSTLNVSSHQPGCVAASPLSLLTHGTMMCFSPAPPFFQCIYLPTYTGNKSRSAHNATHGY